MKLINPIAHPQWNQQIAELDGATIFHTANWAQVLAESYGYRPNYISAFQDGQLTGCLPLMDIRSFLTGRRGVSLPFTDECRPICRTGDVFEALWAHAIDHGQKAGWKHIELRGPHPAYEAEPTHADFAVHTLDLDPADQNLLHRFRDSTRRNIKKAEHDGVTVQLSFDLQAVEAFYRLNCQTRRTHGLPPQPFKFFKKVHEHIIEPEKGLVLLAKHGEAFIAGAVFFHFKNSLLYKYGASDKGHQHLRANNLLMWSAIQWASQNGLHRFDFGRTEPENIGLLQFKRGWGARETILRYYRYDFAARQFGNESRKPKFSYPFFSKLPIPLLKLSGQVLYRHIG